MLWRQSLRDAIKVWLEYLYPALSLLAHPLQRYYMLTQIAVGELNICFSRYILILDRTCTVHSVRMGYFIIPATIGQITIKNTLEHTVFIINGKIHWIYTFILYQFYDCFTFCLFLAIVKFVSGGIVSRLGGYGNGCPA